MKLYLEAGFCLFGEKTVKKATLIFDEGSWVK